jgi:hypothetical protein
LLNAFAMSFPYDNWRTPTRICLSL